MAALRLPSTAMEGWRDMFKRCWYLGLTSFGGPAVHFQIFRRHFVEKYNWLDHQVYQELFALCQALPGPGSTKMLYCINYIHAGFLPGLVSFFIWSLPAAIAAFALALGIAEIDQQLPDPVYALLSGLNAATVGIICLAAVQLSQKAITDKLTRVLVFFGATAGMLYNALWYFPVLMFAGGLATMAWDSPWFCKRYNMITTRLQKSKARNDIEAPTQTASPDTGTTSDNVEPTSRKSTTPDSKAVSSTSAKEGEAKEVAAPSTPNMGNLSWKSGTAIIVAFFVAFIVIMVLRGVLSDRPRGFNIFANLFLAGTIIFGGGPVVIPLLQEYVVVEGWVSPRDFLLGLAIIQVFPGPNFNFAVYLGALAAQGTSLPMFAGAVIGYVAIFTPGLTLHTGTMGLWRTLRHKKWFSSCLRGVNASAVGLVYTAVYRLWIIGYIDAENQRGSSFDRDPWWVVVTATSFVGGMWFKVQAPVAILLGGILGMIWYGVVTS